jgi:Zn finger protein HypA/HybF involved in hydrogenase expression
MKQWWCAECQEQVELSKHGRCEICESEAVDLLYEEDELNLSVAITPADFNTASSCA